MLNVKINAVPSFIKLAAKSGNNLLVVGDPGVGKSSVINGMADENTKVTMLTGSSTYEETVNGIPYRDTSNNSFAKQSYTVPEWFADMIDWSDEHPDGMNILFIDEFNTADGQVLKTFLSILTEHKIPTQKQPLPKNTVIVAAMNPQDQNNGEEFIRPLASRFITLNIESSIDSYRDYLLGNASNEGEIELREKPRVISDEEKEGILSQICDVDWCKWEYGQLHEINPRSVSNFIKACQWLKNVEKDSKRVGMAMLGFSVIWQTETVARKERRNEKAKRGEVLLTEDELGQMSTEDIKAYKEKITQANPVPSIPVLTCIGNCIKVLASRNEAI